MRIRKGNVILQSDEEPIIVRIPQKRIFCLELILICLNDSSEKIWTTKDIRCLASNEAVEKSNIKLEETYEAIGIN